MGTLCFLWLKATQGVDTRYDWPIFAALVSLDSQLLFRIWVYLRGR